MRYVSADVAAVQGPVHFVRQSTRGIGALGAAIQKTGNRGKMQVYATQSRCTLGSSALPHRRVADPTSTPM